MQSFIHTFDSTGPAPSDVERGWQREVTTRVAKQNLLRLDGEDSLAEIEKFLSLHFLDQKPATPLSTPSHKRIPTRTCRESNRTKR